MTNLKLSFYITCARLQRVLKMVIVIASRQRRDAELSTRYKRAQVWSFVIGTNNKLKDDI